VSGLAEASVFVSSSSSLLVAWGSLFLSRCRGLGLGALIEVHWMLVEGFPVFAQNCLRVHLQGTV